VIQLSRQPEYSTTNDAVDHQPGERPSTDCSDQRHGWLTFVGDGAMRRAFGRTPLIKGIQSILLQNPDNLLGNVAVDFHKMFDVLTYSYARK
jgi:hypothetical protein